MSDILGVSSSSGKGFGPVERPTTLTPPPADPAMSKAKRWVPWTLRRRRGARKPSKVPLGPVNDQRSWTYFHAARAVLSDPHIAGIGFQMLGAPGIVAIDIDGAFDAVGELRGAAAVLLPVLEAAGGRFHAELSPSGKGIRIFARETPLPFHDFLDHEHGVEVYTGESPRFLTFTGALLPGFGKGPFDPLPEAAVEILGRFAGPTKWKQGAALPKGAPAAPADDPLPDLSRREDWKKLHPGALKKLRKEHREFLEDGTPAERYASASEHLFAVAGLLLRHLKPPQVYQILLSAPGTFGVALEHREGSEEKARAYLWADVQRAHRSLVEAKKAREDAVHGWAECGIVTEVTDRGVRAKVLQINIINALSRHPAWLNRLGFNVFDGRITVDRRDATVKDLAEISAWVVEYLRWDFEPSRAVFEEALLEAAKTRPWNPVAEELRALEWDGVDRIPEFAAALVADPVHDIDRAILRKWLISFVARGIDPGCQVDTVLCLREKDGGGFKTRFCRLMAGDPERFAESASFAADKDSAMLRGGMRVIELSEGVAVRRSDRHALKSDITKLRDLYRPPYGRTVERRARGFVYVLTTNDIAFLRADQDGLRRIWPVDCRPVIDLKWIEANRNQILAQAVKMYDSGERWWWDKGEEPEALKIRQGSAVAEDFLSSAVEAVASDSDNARRGYVTLAEAKRQVEAAGGFVINFNQAIALTDAMTRAGFRNGRIRIRGKQIRAWWHPSWEEVLEEKEERTRKVISLADRLLG